MSKRKPNIPKATGAEKQMKLTEMQGRVGEGRHSGVRNVAGGGVQRNEARDMKRNMKERDPDVRFGAKGVMHQDIGESICLQPGNDCG